MIIHEGLFDNMVFQRSRLGICDQAFKGSSAVDGDLFFRAAGSRCPAKLKSWTKIGTVRRRSFNAIVKGLPCGGPYSIELKVESKDGDRDAITTFSLAIYGYSPANQTWKATAISPAIITIKTAMYVRFI